MKKHSRIMVALLACVVLFTGLGMNVSAKEEEVPQELTFSTGSIVVGMNPITNATAPDNSNHGKIQEPLVRYTAISDEEAAYLPGAAESWDISEDGLTYTFHFHPDMVWSDDEPFTANDFEYTLKLMADPETAAENAWLFDGLIAGFSECLYDEADIDENLKVEATDDLTLVIELEHPATYFLEMVSSLYPVRQDKYEEWGSKYGSSEEYIICSGQFVVESWDQTTETVYAKNEKNWNAENMKLDKLIMKVIQENATAVQAFLAGETDACGTGDPNWQEMIEAADIAIDKTVPDTAPEFLLFNAGSEWLQSEKIRQALSIGFDRDEYMEAVWDGSGFGIYSLIPDTMVVGKDAEPYHKLVEDKNYIVKDMIEDLGDPKELVLEGMKDLGKEDMDPSDVVIHFASRGTSEKSKKAAEWFKQTWEENLGITLEIDMMEWNIMWDKVDAGDYDIAVAGFGSYYNEPSGLLGLFCIDEGFFNAEKTGWNDENAEKFTELLKSAEDMTEAQDQADAYLEAEEILLNDSCIISPEYLGLSPYYIRKGVEGLYICPVGSWDYTNVEITEAR